MKAFPWIIAALGLGAAAYLVLQQPLFPAPVEDDDVEALAGGAARWGTRQRVAGTTSQFAGKVKEQFGMAIGDDQIADQGVADQIGGAIKDTAGKVAQAAGQAAHEFNT